MVRGLEQVLLAAYRRLTKPVRDALRPHRPWFHARCRGLREVSILFAGAWVWALMGQLLATRMMWSIHVIVILIVFGLVSLGLFALSEWGEKHKGSDISNRELLEILEANLSAKAEAVGPPAFNGPSYASASVGVTGTAAHPSMGNVFAEGNYDELSAKYGTHQNPPVP